MRITVGRLRELIAESRFTGRNIRNPNSIANLVRLFREKYPQVTRQEAEPRLLKRWMSYVQRTDGVLDPQQESQILKRYFDEVWPG